MCVKCAEATRTVAGLLEARAVVDLGDRAVSVGWGRGGVKPRPDKEKKSDQQNLRELKEQEINPKDKVKAHGSMQASGKEQGASGQEGKAGQQQNQYR
jgi:hypothetical protein